MTTPTLTPTPAADATASDEARAAATASTSQQPPTRRQLLHCRYPGKTSIIAMEVPALLLIGILAGVVITLTVLLTNVVKSLPPSALLPGSQSWSTIIAENSRDRPGDHGPDVPELHQPADVASPTKPSGQAPPSSTARTR